MGDQAGAPEALIAGRHLGFPLREFPRSGQARRALPKQASAEATTVVCVVGADGANVVVVVLIARGGFGAEAAPAAREIYQAFFRLKGSKP